MTNMNPQNPGQKEQHQGQPGNKEKEQRDRDNRGRPADESKVSE